MQRTTLVLLLIVLASAGCSHLMPPGKIPPDRENYMEAVSKSWKEQLLTNLVMERYGETLTTLEMTSVTTSYELDNNINANYPIAWHPLHATNPSASWVDSFRNVLTVGAYATYSNKPSITYAPMRGDTLEKNLLEPLPIPKILKSLQTNWPPRYIFPACVKYVNELRNPEKKFFEFARLFHELTQQGVIRISVEEPVEPKVTKVPQDYSITLNVTRQGKGKNEPVVTRPVQGGTESQVSSTEVGTDKNKEEKKVAGFLVVDNYRANEIGAKARVEIDALKKLLWPNASPQGIQNANGRYEVYKIIDGNQYPLQPDPKCDKIFLQSRSVLGVLLVLSDLIQVPQEDLNTKAKLVTPDEKEQLIDLKINCSNEPPREAFVSIKYQGHWFYIDDNDYKSKVVFSCTQGILSMSETTPSQTPVLTLPVE
ncbi:MAG: hypothetical protein ACLP7A_12835 [Desulfobaccales bacterium]